MKLILINLSINNFKGIRDLQIDFDPEETNIYAANEGGKTTISDAWHWLLTGKNSIDQKDFNIKNTVRTDLNRADHEVTATITVDGNVSSLKKIYREKWTKKRGEQHAAYDGNETEHYFNGVPVSQSEYQAKVNGLMAENVLKMISNPLYFNSNNNKWGWQDRRAILLTLAGNISNTEVLDSIATFDNKSEIANLTNVLNSGQTIAEYKRVIANQKKKIKDELIFIPSRIDEANRSMPQVLNWKAIQGLIDQRAQKLLEIDEAINDKAKALQKLNTEKIARQDQIHELSTKRNNIRYEVSNKANQAQSDHRNRFSQLRNKISNAERELSNSCATLNTQKVRIVNLETEIVNLRQRWADVNATELKFDEHEFNCPTCLRAFEPGDIEAKKEQLTINFQTSKELKLQNINSEGRSLVENKANLEASISDLEQTIDEQTNTLNGLKAEIVENNSADPAETPDIETILANNQEYVQLGSDIAALNAKNVDVPAPDNSELYAEKRAVNEEIDGYKKQLAGKDQIVRLEARVVELKNEENDLSQKLADLENTEFLIEKFDRSKMDIMESRVNGRFKHVTFKLFNRQVNGAEEPTCETMYKGVPFNDLNTAGKIWAGIDIINTLSMHYGIHAPIFLDNRESVSYIPETGSQVINLVVSPGDPTPRVESGKLRNELVTA